jgi:hypothetical protein
VKVQIRYYVTRQHPGRPSWGYWAPCLARRSKASGKIEPTLMARLGFALVDCGEDGPLAWAIAERENARWDEALAAYKAKLAAGGGIEARTFPPGSLGEAFARYRATATWRDGKKPRTKEDWLRGFDLIDPVFGDVAPATVSLEDVDGWYAALLKSVGVREAHRAMKIWRALWRVAGTLKDSRGRPYCSRDHDPSLGIRRQTPKPRSAIWREGEAVRLVKGAIRRKFYGLAAALATSWDTMFSPVDVRTLNLRQLAGEGEGSFFSRDRTKTGKAGIGTLGKRARRVLEAYLASMPTLHPDAPIFRTRGGAVGAKGGRPRPPVPYTADTLGDDFREVRNAVFPGDTRQLQDFRRSGAVEALAGGFERGALNAKMANSIEDSAELRATYLPGQTAVVRLADEARKRGRGRLREGK